MSGRLMRSVCTLALIAGAVLVSPVPDARADQPGQSVSALLGRLRLLYRKTEAATEAYNAADERLRGQRAAVERIEEALARSRAELADSRADAGELAREQYRTGRGPLSPTLVFLLGGDARTVLDQGHAFRRAAERWAGTINRLTDGEKRTAALARQARGALDAQLTLAADRQRKRDAVRGRLSEVEELLASLSGGQLAELRHLEARDSDTAQRRLLASGALSGPQPAPSAAAGKALEFAYRQLGKPYLWGAAGPDSFDCSGLTSQAWAYAGREIPRTSQEQWRLLPKVPPDQLRPGDLVVYFEDATHVALYIGNGQVVHAPRPGEYVKVSPLGANPLLGVVRPDPEPA